MKIQLSKTQTWEWKAPWEHAAASKPTDVVGIELESGNPSGCPAVRLQRRKDVLSVTSVGFVPPPGAPLPASWDDLVKQPKWSIPSAFRANFAALTINSVDSYTRQTTGAALEEAGAADGVATSKDGQRSVYGKMADTGSVLQVTLPEYQALWLTRLLREGHRPTAASVQTTACSLLAALTAQPEFCKAGDEVVVYVTQAAIRVAGFRDGLPLLYRECPGAAGAAAMRETVKSSLGIDDEMLETIFASNGIIDTRPALAPLLKPVLSQIDLSIDYLKSRMGSNLTRLYLVGDYAGTNALKHQLAEHISLPVLTPNPFDGLELPDKPTRWSEQYCVGELPHTFLAALGAALAVLEDAS